MSGPNPRVAAVTELYPPAHGGVQETTRLSCEYLAARGLEVRVYTSQLRHMDELKVGEWRTVRNFPSEDVRNGVQVRRFPSGGVFQAILGVLAALSRRLHLPFTPVLYCVCRTRAMRKAALVRELTVFRPDVILAAPASNAILSIVLEAARRLPGARLFVHTALHINDPTLMDFKGLVRRLRRADLALVNTEYEKEYLISQGLDPVRIAVKGPGVDVARFLSLSSDAADKEVVGRVRGKKYVIYFGRKQKGKGMESLVEAVELLRRDHPELYVVLAGQETKYSKRMLAEWSSKLFLINISNVNEATKRGLMEKAFAVSMVSRVDSFGVVYCESWLTRRPVVGADKIGRAHV